jgi:dihydrofolate reductase
MTQITVIAAMSDHFVIGYQQRIPWSQPADMKRFFSLTKGKPCIMGRRTWQSLPGTLPGRPCIVLSSNPSYRDEDATVIAGSLSEALQAARGVPEVMVVGGAAVYAEALPIAHRVYLTRVHANVQGDTYFPIELIDDRWSLTESIDVQPDIRNPYPMTFQTYDANA